MDPSLAAHVGSSMLCYFILVMTNTAHTVNSQNTTVDAPEIQRPISDERYDVSFTTDARDGKDICQTTAYLSEVFEDIMIQEDDGLDDEWETRFQKGV